MTTTKNKKKPGGRRKPSKNRICVVCGKSFSPNASNQKTCSPECSAENCRRKTADFRARIKAENARFRQAWATKRCRRCGRLFKDRIRATIDDCVSHSYCQPCREVIATYCV